AIGITAPSARPCRYADLSALCGQAQFEQTDVVDSLVNAERILEVHSHSTEAYDRGDKFTHYKSSPPLSEYLLVAQHRPHVTHLYEQPDATWIYAEANDLAATLELVTLNCDLPLNEIYRGVSFDAETMSLN